MPEDKKPDLWIPRWRDVNPFFSNSMLNREKVTFRDKSSLTVYEENQIIGEYIIELEQYAIDHPHPDQARQNFRQAWYSKLIGCSAGDVPTEEEARQMPAEELNKWVEAVRRVNPHFFVNVDRIIAELTREQQEAEKKRKPRKRAR